MEPLVADLRSIVHDQKCFIARGLKLANEKTNVDVETLAACASGLVAVYLIQGARAQLLANAILTGVPILLTYVFVDECPSLEILLFHWGSFGISVLLDAMMEDVWPGYYLLKVLLFASLYLKPMLWADKIIAELKAESQAKRVPNLATAVSNDNVVKTAVGSPRVEAGASSSPHIGTAMSGSLPAVSPVYAPEDVMAKDNRHALTPSTSDTDLEALQPELPVNLNDLVFKPEKYMVFNGPFDENTVTYHMTVDNLSKRKIAFAIKSNAIPRLYCVPPFGIIKPKEKQLVAVSVQKFDVGAVDVSRDRIAFDYVFCPPDTQKFSHRLFGGSETRRRKNIFIKYNP